MRLFGPFQFHPELDMTGVQVRLEAYMEGYLGEAPNLDELLKLFGETPESNSLVGKVH